MEFYGILCLIWSQRSGRPERWIRLFTFAWVSNSCVGAGPKLQGLFPNLLLKAEWELFVLGALVGWRVSLLMQPVPTKDSTSTFHP
ncbi:Uncharacterized protein HZ326_11128 [Fusarium oxysporum f. sp. albedinis]|nr:Uncharacterized protein HZ326_11128 [Fusarium oxysporum f. sp. albedinis]